MSDTTYQPDKILRCISRVIAQSGCSARQFYWGLSFRVLERGFEIIPFMLCFFWLLAVHSPEPDQTLQLFKNSSALIVMLLLTFIGQLIFAYLGQYLSYLGSYRIMAGYRERLIDHIRHLPLGFVYQYRTGYLADILTDDIKKIESIFTHVVANLFSVVALPLLTLIALLCVDWRLTLALVAGFIPGLWVLIVTKNLLAKAGARQRENFRDTAGMIVEFVEGIKTLRLFNRADVWLQKLNKRFEKLSQLSLGIELWGAGPVVAYRFILELGLVFLLLACAHSFDRNVPMFQAILFLLLAHKLLSPLLEIAECLTMLRLAAQSEAKVHSLLSSELLAEPECAITPTSYDIFFNNVSFAYQEETKTVLEQISFSAPQNTITAIVGPSGSGKSTLMNLLVRFYDPQKGSISIGGHDLKAIGSEQLYQQISMVFQQVQLFDDSVMENLRTGKTDASDKEIIAACKAANCHDFIKALPEGYHTHIGESGAKLSGGERQRLSIARALLKDAPILLLDEATASVDSDSQFEIQKALSQLAKGRTVVMIAHRLNTIKHADHILVLEKGKLVEQGKHQELIAKQGLYHQLWQAQGHKS
ncbi:ABC transporter ATP-binding protein [Psychromonas hadalis]|uniref:ABC transporter ATP-binding protein n=1 Tax=Psychromonas hadalis TaxID=211669 RepID=UPI0003B3CBD2|nr:ABC transporter ATP-binding protein [Psychromonas hadalis]